MAGVLRGPVPPSTAGQAGAAVEQSRQSSQSGLSVTTRTETRKPAISGEQSRVRQVFIKTGKPIAALGVS